MFAAGAGPYKLASALTRTGYADIVDGLFPAGRRYYLAQVGQTYSSTYGGLANFGQGEDLLADSWTVDGVIYTKQDIIDITTGASGSGVLNARVAAIGGVTNRTTLGMKSYFAVCYCCPGPHCLNCVLWSCARYLACWCCPNLCGRTNFEYPEALSRPSPSGVVWR